MNSFCGRIAHKESISHLKPKGSMPLLKDARSADGLLSQGKLVIQLVGTAWFASQMTKTCQTWGAGESNPVSLWFSFCGSTAKVRNAGGEGCEVGLGQWDPLDQATYLGRRQPQLSPRIVPRGPRAILQTRVAVPLAKLQRRRALPLKNRMEVAGFGIRQQAATTLEVSCFLGPSWPWVKNPKSYPQ